MHFNQYDYKKWHLIKKICSFKTTFKKAKEIHNNICPLHNNNSCLSEMLQKYILSIYMI